MYNEWWLWCKPPRTQYCCGCGCGCVCAHLIPNRLTFNVHFISLWREFSIRFWSPARFTTATAAQNANRLRSSGDFQAFGITNIVYSFQFGHFHRIFSLRMDPIYFYLMLSMMDFTACFNLCVRFDGAKSTYIQCLQLLARALSHHLLV